MTKLTVSQKITQETEYELNADKTKVVLSGWYKFEDLVALVDAWKAEKDTKFMMQQASQVCTDCGVSCCDCWK